MVYTDFTGKYGTQYTFIAANYEFRFNIVTNTFEYRKLLDGKPDDSKPYIAFDDRSLSTLLIELSENDKDLAKDKLVTFIESEQLTPDYDPFIDYFSNIEQWDGKDYIGQLAETIKTDNDERFRNILERFLVGSLDCLLVKNRVNDVCLVFQGSQGIGKTRWMRKLLPPQFRDQYFDESPIDTRKNDDMERLGQFWMIHLDELESLKSNEVSALKSFMTREKINVRSAYARYKSKYTRRASFLGSVNEQEFLTDTTGNRRWLIFRVLSINYQHTVDVDKVWSQIHHLWKQGYKHWFDNNEIKELNKRNEEFRSITAEEELLVKNFDFPGQDDAKGEWMSSTEVMIKIASVTPQMMNKMGSGNMGKALTSCCVQKKKIRGTAHYWVKYIGVEPDHGDVFESSKGDNNTSAKEIQDDLPF